MPYCEKCGHLLDKSAQRCEICGAQCSPAEPRPPVPSAKPGPPPPPVAKKTSPPPPPVGKQPPPVPGMTVPGGASILPALGPQTSSLPPPPRESILAETQAGNMPPAPAPAGSPRSQPPGPPKPQPPPPRPPVLQPPSAPPPAVPPRVPAVPAPRAPVAGAKSALIPVLIVGAAVVLLLVVALGGYFFVYPRLRGAEAPPPTASAELSSTPSASPIPAAGASSDSPAGPDTASEAESASREPGAVGESETMADEPSASAEEMISREPVTPVESGRASGRSSPVNANHSKPVNPRASPIPEPVSSPGASDSNPGQLEPPSEPAAAEPAPDPVDRSPSPSPAEPETSQAAPDRQPPAQQHPAYEGPKKGVVIWTGEADKGMTVVIEGASASVGQVQGALPGVACIVRLSAPNVAVTEGPGPRNGYRRISLRFNKKGRFSVPVEWEVLH